jgi:hypothetical protein
MQPTSWVTTWRKEVVGGSSAESRQLRGRSRTGLKQSGAVVKCEPAKGSCVKQLGAGLCRKEVATGFIKQPPEKLSRRPTKGSHQPQIGATKQPDRAANLLRAAQ